MTDHGDQLPANLPQLRLDGLLDELQSRLDAARSTRDRIHGLLEAVLSVGRDLKIDHVLHSILDAAAALVDARYGALGIIGPDGKRLSRFLTVGVSEEVAARIGPLPTGGGVLGEVIRHPEPLRLDDLAGHAASYGFPAGHPAMRTFLGVPIRVRDEVFGNLYLSEKRDGSGFSAEDESVLETLAVAAGVAIDNAHLYEESVRRQRWLAAGAEVTRRLLSGGPSSEVLALIADEAFGITRADLAAVAFPRDGGRLAVELAVGRQAAAHRDLVLPVEGSLMGAAYAAGTVVTSEDVTADPRVTAGPPRFAGLGPATAVPMGTAEHGVRGVLLLARAAGEPPFTEADTEPLHSFAGQAALAMELAGRRRDAEQLALLEDRDRIARDLHDLAIQRLFATGMTLQSAEPFIQHPNAAERVLRAVDDLDETIKIIRSAIFGLRSREGGVGVPAESLRARAVRVAEEAASLLGFAPRLRLEGLLDTDVPRETADHVVAVLGEALANTARHARAGRVDVSLTARRDEVVLTVTDDGVGMRPGPGRRSGLRNLTERAEQVGGKLQVDRAPGGGTRLEWRAPLGG